MKTYVKTGEKIEIESYPYGGLRTKAYFSVEFNPKHGYRSVFQTINPKTGRLNNPKKSTYVQFKRLYKDAETGHANFEVGNLYDWESNKKFFAMVLNAIQFEGLDPVELTYLLNQCISWVKLDFVCAQKYCELNADDLKPLYLPVLAQLKACRDSGEEFGKIVPLWHAMTRGVEALKSAKAETEAA